MDIQYSVEFRPVKYKKYKQGAPAHLLAKGGRWQEAGEFGGWTNMGYEPSILTVNKAVYECAPEMYAMLKIMLDGGGVDSKKAASLLKKARGE